MVTRRDDKKEKRITLIILPNARGNHSFQISLGMPMVSAIAVALLVVFSFIGVYFFKSVHMSGRLLHYYYLQSENKKLSEDIKIFVSKTKVLESGVNQLEKRERELRKMLGLKNKQPTKQK